MLPWPRRLAYPQYSLWGACKCGHEVLEEKICLILDQWLDCELRPIEYLLQAQRIPGSHLSVPLICPNLSPP